MTDSKFFVLRGYTTFEVVLLRVSPFAISNPMEIIKPTQFELGIEFCLVHFLTGYLASVTQRRHTHCSHFVDKELKPREVASIR